MDSTNINLRSLGTWKETENKHSFQKYFVFHENVTVITDEFSKLESHNKTLFANAVPPEVQPTSKTCLRQKSSSKHRKVQMITRGK